jgi:DNA repair exonuclease SbcCD ATPase subunit
MKIKSLTITDFGKFKAECKFNFIDKGIHVIVGKNGSGKTTLFKSITAILTGLSDEEKERYVTVHSHGVLTVENGQSTIRLHRSFKTDEIELFKVVNGSEKSIYVGKHNLHDRIEANYLKILAHHLSLNIDLFNSVSFISHDHLITPIDMVLNNLRDQDSKSNINYLLRDLLFSYDAICGKKSRNESSPGKLELTEKQLGEKQKIATQINSQILRQKAIRNEIDLLEDRLNEIVAAEEIQTKQLDRLEKLCEYIQEEKRIHERVNELHQQKSMIEDIEHEIDLLEDELKTYYPQLGKYSGIQLKEDVYQWRELQQKQDVLERQLSQISDERKRLENEIAKEVHLYQNVGPTFSMELTEFRMLTDEEHQKHTALKRLILDIEMEKKMLVHQQLIDFILLTTGIVIISIVQLNFKLSFNLMLIISTLLFCIGIVILEKWRWNIKRNAINEQEHFKNEIGESLHKLELRRQEMGLRYYRFQNIEKTDQHIIGYSKYREKQRKIDELIIRANVLRAQSTAPGFGETLAFYRKKYGKSIALDDPEIFEKIDHVIELQQKILALKHALTTHRRKELLIQKESDLSQQEVLMKTRIEDFFSENTSLRHLMENTGQINAELHYAEQQVEKLTLKQSELIQKIQQKKIELASISDFGGINIMHLKEDIQHLQENIKKLTFKKDVLSLAIDAYLSVRKEYNRNFCDSLNRLINDQFQKITDANLLKISLAEDLHLHVWDNGAPISTGRLSENMQIFLSLSARLAVVRYLAGEITLPLILDDPFTGFDAERRTGIQNILKELSQTHQIVLLTIDEKYKKWGDLSNSLS